LRFDCAKVLERVYCASSIVDTKTQWSALPSFNDTAKAAVTPVAALLNGAMTPVI
jgi:hypothetical protein